MLQTKIISEDACVVSFEPTEILVRKRGKVHYGTEKPLVTLKDGKLHIFLNVAKQFGIEVIPHDEILQVKNGQFEGE